MTKEHISQDRSPLFIKLQRSHKCALRITDKLNSYIYEPKDYETFEELRSLRQSFKDLVKEQQILLNNFSGLSSSKEKAMTLLKLFKSLEQQLASYILKCNYS